MLPIVGGVLVLSETTLGCDGVISIKASHYRQAAVGVLKSTLDGKDVST